MESTPKSTVRTGIMDYSLTDLDRDSWQQLHTAPSQKDSYFKTFTMATTTPDGAPDARMVVLRQVDETSRTLWFHTDVRAQKVTHLHRNPQAVLLFWDEKEQVQLRCRVSTTIHTTDAMANEQWASTWEGSRKMYLSEHEPGSSQLEPYPGFPAYFGEKLPTRDESEAGRTNFAVVECRVLEMDYLHLSRAGQTRARFDYGGETVSRQWLAP
ncbi:MAG: pyridoxamine 5'-phosphate oxidase family protein [Rudanella sp.]|nr:pyridoxamine 5'-phosphate oxidase family protein [Rudanella sp.]